MVKVIHVSEQVRRAIEATSDDVAELKRRAETLEADVNFRQANDVVVGHYLSFTDASLPKGTQFLGGVFVPESELENAVTRSHLLGINPGGSIKCFPLVWMPESEWHDRLLSKEEVLAVPGPEDEL